MLWKMGTGEYFSEFTRESIFSMQYGSKSSKNLIQKLQGEGEFKGLEGIAVNSKGNILVADRENHRVQIF